jgi:hypothetical protein
LRITNQRHIVGGTMIVEIEGGLRRDLDNGVALFLYHRMFNSIVCIGKTDNTAWYDDQY